MEPEISTALIMNVLTNRTAQMVDREDTCAPPRNQEILAVSAALSIHFPHAFPAAKEARVPLKIGIHADIRARWPQVTHRLLDDVLGKHTGSRSYLRKLQEGAHRIDLDGNPSGCVSARDAEVAKKFLARRERRTAAATSIEEGAP